MELGPEIFFGVLYGHKEWENTWCTMIFWNMCFLTRPRANVWNLRGPKEDYGPGSGSQPWIPWWKRGQQSWGISSSMICSNRASPASGYGRQHPMGRYTRRGRGRASGRQRQPYFLDTDTASHTVSHTAFFCGFFFGWIRRIYIILNDVFLLRI